MKQVDLVRLERSDEGVFGMLRIDGQVQCVTLEPPQRGNEKNVSCIPPGRYDCRRRVSRRFGETFEVLGVPNRSDILFHAGNLATDSRGCILLGEGLGRVQGRRAIVRSRSAVSVFCAALQREQGFRLDVVEGFGPENASRDVAEVR